MRGMGSGRIKRPDATPRRFSGCNFLSLDGKAFSLPLRKQGVRVVYYEPNALFRRASVLAGTEKSPVTSMREGTSTME